MAKSDKKELTVMAATRIIALWNVSRPDDKQDPEYQLREMSRWFAREFNYKLHEVDDIPIETIALHYFEHHYKHNLTPEEREEELRYLTSTEDDLADQKKADDEFLAKTIREAQVIANKGKELASQLKQLSGPTPTVEQIKAELNQPQPSISMQFVDPKELEAMEEWDILGDTSPKK